MVLIKMLQMLWQKIDIICYLLALCFFVYGAFLLGRIWGVFAVALSLFLVGILSELIAGAKGGDQ